MDAIKNGNRAEAWYHIRYDFNKDLEAGVSKRRFYESEIFGLFAGSTPTEEEAKDFFKMMRFHEDRINEIENLHVATRDMIAEANQEYGAGSVHYLNTFSDPALTLTLHKIFHKLLHFHAAFCNTSIKWSKSFLTA
jgi:hypothetical protein